MKILITVGAQLSFERLTNAMDEWAARHAEHEFFAQIGPTAAPPSCMAWARFMDPPAFRTAVTDADLIVAHAGMGSILTALCQQKRIIVMPRRGDLQETRNDHQLATADRLSQMKLVAVAADRDALFQWLGRYEEIPLNAAISSHADSQLINTLRDFIVSPSAH